MKNWIKFLEIQMLFSENKYFTYFFQLLNAQIVLILNIV